MFCMRCAVAFGDTARFCTGCGAPKPDEAPLSQATAGNSFFSRLGTLFSRSSSTVPRQPDARPGPSATEQRATGIGPSIYGIGNDEAFTLAFLAYERAFRTYCQQHVRCEYEKTLAWAAFNVFVSVKNGLLQRWHDTGECFPAPSWPGRLRPAHPPGHLGTGGWGALIRQSSRR